MWLYQSPKMDFAIIGLNIVLFLTLATAQDITTSNQFSLMSGCVCTGYEVIYTCSINGGGNTIWNGSAFNCPSNSDSSNNQILLRHSGFGIDSMGTCNSGEITGIGVSSENGYFVSQLNVTISLADVGRQISCFYENGSTEVLVGTNTIELTSGDDLSAPSKVSLTNASPESLFFSWAPVTHSCSSLHYNIISENCGKCPRMTITPTISCSLPEIQPNVSLECSFQVQAVICDNAGGELSNTSTFGLRLPDVPVISAIPTYSEEDDKLQMITLSFSKDSTVSPPISDHISSSPFSYNVSFFNETSIDIPCLLDTILLPSFCTDEICSKGFNITLTSCFNSSQVAYSAFANNIIGRGGTTNLRHIDGKNSFAHVFYDEENDRISCKFINQDDTSEKQCLIESIICDPEIVSANATDMNAASTLQITLKTLENSRQALCNYVVLLKNATYTIYVKGTLSIGQSPGQNIGTLISTIAAVVIAIIVIILMILVIVVALLCVVKTREKNRQLIFRDIELTIQTEGLESIEEEQFRLYLVEKNCELSSLIVKHNLTYRIGSIYYEFARNEENIPEDRKIILMDKATKKLFTGENARKMIGLPEQASTSLRKPNLPKYHVFVQSKGIGHRPLQKGTRILYEINPPHHTEESNIDNVLIPVNQKEFKKLKVKKDSQLKKFVEDECSLSFTRGCAFFEFVNSSEDIGTEKEVILLSKATGDMFTGSGAMCMIPGAPGQEVKRPDLPEWRVFIQSKYLGARHLKKDTTVLYKELKINEDELIPDNNYCVFEVKIQCQMEEFVVKQLGVFERRNILFEFTNDEEEITEDKKVVIMNKKTKNIFTGKKVLDRLDAPCAPGKHVNNPKLKDYRVFIQSAGRGTRSLEPGTCLLYQKI